MTVKSVDSESLHSSTQPPHTSRPRRPLEGNKRQMSKACGKDVVVLGQGLEDFHYFTLFLADLGMEGEDQEKETGERKEGMPPSQSQLKRG